ncbi:MAG TPA: hypothetical protein VGH45_14675 [Solirubrobacteraceae bacterium]
MIGLALGISAVGCGHDAQRAAQVVHDPTTIGQAHRSAHSRVTAATGRRAGPAAPGRPARATARYPVGERIVTFVDRSRRIQPAGQRSRPRTLVTVVRYPAASPAPGTDVRNAAPARAGGPFPLVVFGHGFAVTPKPYARLLRAWTRAGYVVAAPIFPLESSGAPGGPDESDLVNQPRDLRFVISRMLAASADPRNPLAGTVAADRIAVAGQSDGGETALATAYDSHYLDDRVRAAMILSGAEIPGAGGFFFPPRSPPLLAVQGTADTINQPRFTYAFFRRARRPKFLLRLLGAGHLPPYTVEQPQLSIVERVTVAFMDRYLKHEHSARVRMVGAGDVPGTSRLITRP